MQVKGADGYRTIASFGIDRSNPNIEVGFYPYAPVSVSVAKTTGREFRLIVRGAGKDTGFAEVQLSSLPRVERYAEKTFAKMFQSPLPYWEEYQWRDQPVLDDASLAVDPAEVVDITECLDGDRLGSPCRGVGRHAYRDAPDRHPEFARGARRHRARSGQDDPGLPATPFRRLYR